MSRSLEYLEDDSLEKGARTLDKLWCQFGSISPLTNASADRFPTKWDGESIKLTIKLWEETHFVRRVVSTLNS